VFCFVESCFSANVQVFGYEFTPHENGDGNAAEVDIICNNFNNIYQRHMAIPSMPAAAPLIAGGNDTVTFWASLLPVPMAGFAQHNYNFGADLNYQAMALVALGRPDIGIPTNFAHQAIIDLLAAIPGALGIGALPIIAGIMGVNGPLNLQAYINRAFGGGGYTTPITTMTYRLRHNVLPGGLFVDQNGIAANLIVIHARVPNRISRSMMELADNAQIATAIGGAAYVSLKFIINNTFLVIGLPAPRSATVISYDDTN
jgi:hypothetical protein